MLISVFLLNSSMWWIKCSSFFLTFSGAGKGYSCTHVTKLCFFRWGKQCSVVWHSSLDILQVWPCWSLYLSFKEWDMIWTNVFIKSKIAKIPASFGMDCGGEGLKYNTFLLNFNSWVLEENSQKGQFICHSFFFFFFDIALFLFI